MTEIIITMAGFGRRFLDAGYAQPKYEIMAHGRTLFAWSMLSLSSFIAEGARFTYVVRAADAAEPFIRREAGALGILQAGVVSLEAPTDGQATSALLAGPSVSDHRAPMLIYNIDTFVHPSALPFAAVRGDGWIPCFPGEGDAWSFAAADAYGRVREVREKVRISGHATVGLYGFASFDAYEQLYRQHFAREALEKGEAYVAPMYNTLIAAGGEVFLHEVHKTAVIPLGTPAQVEAFARGEPPNLR